MPSLAEFIGAIPRVTPATILQQRLEGLDLSSRAIRDILPIPPAFNELYVPARYKAFYSGRGAAKSHSFASATLTLAQEKPKRILCCREIQNSIRDSVKRLLDDKIEAGQLRGFYTSTDTEIRGANGSLYIFAGLRTDVDKIKSMEGIDIVWVEEAQSVSKKSLEILIPTVRKEDSEIWFSWNPRKKDDPVDVMFRGGEPPPGSIVRQVSYRDNPWFPETLRREMDWDLRRDPTKHAHVWEGGYQTRTEAQVFKNWRVGEPAEFKTDGNTIFRFGGDWGFSTDPSVLVRSYIEARNLYIDYEAWALACDIDYLPFLFGGCEDEELIQKNLQAWQSPGMKEWKTCRGIPGARKWPIRADSARPETISYMRNHGFPNIKPAKKGAGSVEDGIEFLKAYDIIINPRCAKTIDEFVNYCYKVDPKTNEVLPILIDKKNHCIDSERYAVEDVRRAGLNYW